MTENVMTRREMLRRSGLVALGLGGAMGVGLAVRGTSAGAFGTGEGAAYEAWSTLATDGSARSLISAAILGANPHNTQPWRFAIDGNVIAVAADPRRSLPATDPTGFELVTGLGAAIENLAVAAAASGKSAVVVVSGADRYPEVARVSLRPSRTAEGAGLFPAITQRHTNRGPYRSDLTLPAGSLDDGAALVRSLPFVELTWLDGVGRDRFGDLTIRATEAIMADREQSLEISRWWRATRAEIDIHRDGMTLAAQGLSPVTAMVATLLPPTSQQQNDTSWLANTERVHVRTAAAYGLLSVEDPDATGARIAVGRAFQRLHLWATTRGLAMQPLNQVTERINRDRTRGGASAFEGPLADLTPPRRTTVFAFRIGVPTLDPGRSPRRPLADVIDG